MQCCSNIKNQLVSKIKLYQKVIKLLDLSTIYYYPY